MITINAAYLTPADIQGLPDPFQVEWVPSLFIQQAQREPTHLHFENLDQAPPLVKHLIEAFNDPIRQPCRFPRLHPDSVVTF